MKNDVFNAWFKELCSLVFVQTFQAFLLAIVMSIIIKALSLSNSDSIDAIGLLAIIALFSFSKIELLIKNIFGLTSGQGDPSLASGSNSFMKGYLALKGAGRIANNGRKLIGGTGRAIAGQVRYMSAKKPYYDAKIAELQSPKNANTINSGSTTKSTASPGSTEKDDKKQSLDSADINKLVNEISQLTRALEKNQNSDDAKKREEKLEKLKEAVDKAKKERDDGLKSAIQGLGETAGAFTGATVGALYGLSKGDDVINLSLSGAGAGDVAGEAVANVAVSAGKTVVNLPKVPSKVKEVGKSTASEIKYHGVYKDIDRIIKEKDKNNMKEINSRLESYRKARNTSSNTRNSVDDA